MQRRFRLQRAADFDLLRRHGRRCHHPLAILIVRENGGQHSRFGFSASKRVGKATARNRAKRLLREAVRMRLDEICSGFDCHLIALQATSEASLDEVNGAVAELLHRSGLLKAAK